MIFTILMVAIVIACILLTIIILAQNPKGGGLSGAFGGTSSASFGIQRTNDFMEKTTWTLGGVIVVLIFLSVVLTAKPSTIMVPTSVPTTTTNAMPQSEVQPTETATAQEAK
jgi:preprotein translocase subunit SecG